MIHFIIHERGRDYRQAIAEDITIECVFCKQAGRLTTKRLEVDHIKQVRII